MDKDKLVENVNKLGMPMMIPDKPVNAEETLAAGWKPVACSASSILGKYDGVCISTCVKRDFLAKIGTAKGTCDDEHFCAPCKNPLDGKPTGAPGCPP